MFSILPLALLAAAGATANRQSADPQSYPANKSWDPIAIESPAPDPQHVVCLKMRVYWFERNDGKAPKMVRETTCSTVRPYAKKASAPKARLIPTN